MCCMSQVSQVMSSQGPRLQYMWTLGIKRWLLCPSLASKGYVHLKLSNAPSPLPVSSASLHCTKVPAQSLLLSPCTALDFLEVALQLCLWSHLYTCSISVQTVNFEIFWKHLFFFFCYSSLSVCRRTARSPAPHWVLWNILSTGFTLLTPISASRKPLLAALQAYSNLVSQILPNSPYKAISRAPPHHLIYIQQQPHLGDQFSALTSFPGL